MNVDERSSPWGVIVAIAAVCLLVVIGLQLRGMESSPSRVARSVPSTAPSTRPADAVTEAAVSPPRASPSQVKPSRVSPTTSSASAAGCLPLTGSPSDGCTSCSLTAAGCDPTANPTETTATSCRTVGSTRGRTTAGCKPPTSFGSCRRQGQGATARTCPSTSPVSPSHTQAVHPTPQPTQTASASPPSEGPTNTPTPTPSATPTDTPPELPPLISPSP